MTHGEEPGPETHKDSAVLTYLEGLLMHPVVAGPGATVGGRSEAAHSNQQQVDKGGRPPNHGPTAPAAGPSLGASQHLKKARLLRSGAWNDSASQRISSPSVEINGQGGGMQNGALEGSPHAGESTLLASLLQSFSSRLQSVAMSQNSNTPPSEASPPLKAPPAEKETLPVYGTASSRLKGLMRKNKLQNHNSTPYSRRGHSQDRPSESPRSAHSATPPSDSVSCAERLKAVANMVKIRSSPAPSPKPSVACSQLALLLSSEAHLQQYSREHALKAQLSGRSASERLAAMANQQHSQDKRPPSVGGSLPGASETLSSLTTQNGMSTSTSTTTLPRSSLSSPQSPSLLRSHSQSSPPTHTQSHSHPPREKRGFDSRPTRPPQTCSSLLLLLLNNHNQKQLTKNGHLEDTFAVLPPSGPSSVASDSECSTQERSMAKDSDAESSYSSCSPIDLSMRSRTSTHDTSPKTNMLSTSLSSSSPPSSLLSSAPAAFSPRPSTQSSTAFSPTSAAISTVNTSSSLSFSTSSLDQLTESLIKKWTPEPSGSVVTKNKEPETSPDLKSHPKLTLMQLLLERRNNEMANKAVSHQDLPLDVTMATMSRSQPKGLVAWDENRTNSPTDQPVAPAHPLYPLSREHSGALSPYSYPSPHVQSSPLDLCKSKTFPVEKPPEPGFSASKLLQNLAQCGTSSPPIPSSKPLGPELDNRPLALLERLNAPLHRTTTTPLSEGPSGSTTPFSRKEPTPPSTQIENLLERRTVLQLLLGNGSASSTPSRKDRPSGSGRRSVEVTGGHNEKSPSASIMCDSSNGPTLDVKVKTEHLEEKGQSAGTSEELSSRKRLSSEKNSPLSDYRQPDLKTEPRPAEVIAKYGLLSQLLKQQTATYYTSAAVQVEPQLKQVKEEQRDYPSPSPKKRRLCSERIDSLNNGNSPRAGEHCNLGFASPGVQEESDLQRSPKAEEGPQRSPPNETLSRESRGFNVLKQLLLSDNCLKELSQQSRAAPSPSVLQANGKANGSIHSQPAHNHNFLSLPGWHPHGPLSSGPPGHLRALPTPPAGDGSSRTQWVRQPASWPISQKRDTPTLVKKEPESPSRWSGPEKEDEDCDSNPDSPRLSRSNPILYYMLQKGSLQLRKDMKEQAEGTQPVVRVKEEPISDLHAYEHSSYPQSPPHNDKHSHKSQGLSQSFE